MFRRKKVIENFVLLLLFIYYFLFIAVFVPRSCHVDQFSLNIPERILIGLSWEKSRIFICSNFLVLYKPCASRTQGIFDLNWCVLLSDDYKRIIIHYITLNWKNKNKQGIIAFVVTWNDSLCSKYLLEIKGKVKSSLHFPNVKILAVPATSLVNDFG